MVEVLFQEARVRELPTGRFGACGLYPFGREIHAHETAVGKRPRHHIDGMPFPIPRPSTSMPERNRSTTPSAKGKIASTNAVS